MEELFLSRLQPGSSRLLRSQSSAARWRGRGSGPRAAPCRGAKLSGSPGSRKLRTEKNQENPDFFMIDVVSDVV